MSESKSANCLASFLSKSEVKADDSKVLPSINLKDFRVTAHKCAVSPEYFMSDEELAKNYITGWIGPGQTGPPTKAYGFEIIIDHNDVKKIEELDAKLKPIFPGKNGFSYCCSEFGMNETVTPEEVKVVDKHGFSLAFAAMKILLPNLTEDQFRKLRFSSKGDYPSEDHEYNTHLVTVTRIPAVTKEAKYKQIKVSLTWDDYDKIKDKLNPILAS